MVRTAQFAADDFLSAAITLIADQGPGVTLAAIARHIGAPTGSVYHRFASRDEIIARAWLKTHAAFLDAVALPLRESTPEVAAQALVAWAASDRPAAAFLLLHDLESLFDGQAPGHLRAEIVQQQTSIDMAFQNLVARLDPNPTERLVAAARFAVFDGPIALLKPALTGNEPIPAWTADMAAGLSALLPSHMRAA